MNLKLWCSNNHDIKDKLRLRNQHLTPEIEASPTVQIQKLMKLPHLDRMNSYYHKFFNISK